MSNKSKAAEKPVDEIVVGAEAAAVIDYLIEQSNGLAEQIAKLQEKQQTIGAMAQEVVNKEATRLALKGDEWQFSLATKSYTRIQEKGNA